MTDPNDQKLLELCVAKVLVDYQTAQALAARAQQGGQRMADVLVSTGVVAPATLQALQHEIDQELAPTAIAGFRILRKLGQGGMGTVYEAEQTSLRRTVALKVVAPQFVADAQVVDRFMREARAAAAVNHPNIITVIDVGYDNGLLYMVLELMAGGDAAQLAASAGGRLPEARALEIIRDCSRGLQALHEAQLIHRDIKPANIFITREGAAKLADLGLARSQQGTDRLTGSGYTVGTPAFMSPEQAGGRHQLDIRSDIYALGSSLFTLLTGEPPFTGKSLFATAAKVLNEPAPDPRAFVPGLSEATCRVVARCLAKPPPERFPSPRDLEMALTGALEETLAIGRGKAVPVASASSVPSLRRPIRDGIRWALIVLAVATIVIACVAWMVTG